MPLHLPSYWFVFDVESIGLHGDSFSCGFVVMNPEEQEPKWAPSDSVILGCVALLGSLGFLIAIWIALQIFLS